MNLQDLLIPTVESLVIKKYQKNSNVSIEIMSEVDSSKISQSDVLLLGYLEDRNSQNIGASKASKLIREQLQNLYPTSKKIKVLDLGDCVQGKTVKDSYFVLQEVIKLISIYNKPIIIFGGTQEASVCIAQECFHQQAFPTATFIDSKLDIDVDSKEFSNHNYLNSIVKNTPKVRLVNIGNQEFLSSPASFEWFKQNYYPLFRLGKVFTQRLLAEPLIRDAQFISFDMSAIRYSDSPASISANSIGMYSEDACQLAWYSGFSEKMKIFFLSELNPENDVRNVSTLLSAQIIWHVLDGISQRKSDSLTFLSDLYKKYYVKNSFLEHDLTFYESFSSQYLWVEIPLKNKKNKRVIPCSSNDYNDSLNDTLPESWLIEFNRIFKKA